MNKIKMKLISRLVVILAVVIMIIPAMKSYAGEVSVTFDQESYEIRENTDFNIEVNIKANGGIGYYHVEIVYDAGRIEYRSGADELKEEGVLVLEGTGMSDSISYNLKFYSAHSGPAGIAVDSAEMYGNESGSYEAYILDTQSTATITVDGTDILGYDFIKNYNDKLAEIEAEKEAEKEAEAAEKAAKAEEFAQTIAGQSLGKVTLADGNTLYVVDHSALVPGDISWKYKLVPGTYQGQDVTYLTDIDENVQILYLMDDNRNGYPYAVKDGYAYPVTKIIARDDVYVYTSVKAAMHTPDDITDEEAASIGMIYAIDAEGSGDFYRLGIDNQIYRIDGSSLSENEVVDTASIDRDNSSKTIIMIVVGVVLFLAVQVVLIYFIRKPDEDKTDDIDIMDLDEVDVLEDEVDNVDGLNQTSNKTIWEEVEESIKADQEKADANKAEVYEEVSEPIISVQNVTMKFTVSNSNASSIKEYFIQAVKKQVKFRELVALDNVSFDAYKGEVIGIIGTNGSGKSTLLRIISGAMNPTKGKVIVDQKKVQLLTLGTGFDMELSARENVYLNGSLIGYTKEFIDEHYDEIVEFAELEGFMEAKVKTFSSGMVSRLGFAIATIGDAAEILILDEVLSVGDEFFRKKSLKRVKEMIHGGSTVLMVSHGMGTIIENCSKVVWIEKGKLQMVGDAKVVCHKYSELRGA